MSKIEKAIRDKETEVWKFRPSNEFYKRIGISKKRFWQIVRGEKSATVDEITIIARVLEINSHELI